ncbi:MAG: hypothetical protein WD048_07275 [Chitinophagales bacterium]
MDLLKSIYTKVYITDEIAKEYNKPLPDWVIPENVKDIKYQRFLLAQIDLGEASVLALAIEKENPLVILDDLKARKFAKNIGFKIHRNIGCNS